MFVATSARITEINQDFEYIERLLSDVVSLFFFTSFSSLLLNCMYVEDMLVTVFEHEDCEKVKC